MKTIHKASLDTKHFSFEAYGLRKSDALMALGDGLRMHQEQYQLADGWFDMDGVEYREIELGAAYRDRERL